MNPNMAQIAVNSAGSAPKQPAMAEHAERLHNHAAQLAEINGRLASLLSRLHGPTPEGTSPNKDSPQPTGVLYVAQFGAERIGAEIDKLRQATSALEQFA